MVVNIYIDLYINIMIGDQYLRAFLCDDRSYSFRKIGF